MTSKENIYFEKLATIPVLDRIETSHSNFKKE